jgi:hypothetical protein
MNPFWRSIFLALTALIAGCGKDINKAVGAVNTAAQALVTASDKLALAVPGERWQRIVDAATKGDSAQKAAAFKQIERLFGVDMESTYEISVWYGFNANYKPATVANALGRPQTEAEIQKIVRAELAAAVREVVPAVSYSQNGIVSQVNTVSSGDESKAVDHLVNAITAHYGAIVVPAATQTIRRPYAPFEGVRWLLILVNEADLDTATKGREDQPIARALAHKTGDTNTAFANNWTVEFTKAEFLARPPVECGVLKTKVRWVTHDMTNSPIIDKAFIDALDQLHHDVDEMNKALGAVPAREQAQAF